jgi:hypothetical protein
MPKTTRKSKAKPEPEIVVPPPHKNYMYAHPDGVPGHVAIGPDLPLINVLEAAVLPFRRSLDGTVASRGEIAQGWAWVHNGMGDHSGLYLPDDAIEQLRKDRAAR